MGGAVRKVGEAVGIVKEKQATSPAPLAELAKMATGKSDQGGAAETLAARRRARRGGRALLSEARLAPEQGVSTLGNTEV
jgi:hypothetical protein